MKRNVTPSGLPAPPGGADVPRPSGTPGNLTVLDWAGCRGAVTYTFDDGQPSHLAHYEALQATGVAMTFYVTADWIRGTDAAWARVAGDGHEIGNHTVSHPYANLADLDAEIDGCTKHIIERLGQAGVWTMAFPYGDVGWKEAARSRFFLSRGVGGPAIAPNGGADPFNLPCYMANAGETAAKFNALVDAARAEGHWLILLFHTITPTAENWYAPVDIAEIVCGIEHAKSGGDLWLDTLANVGAYWVGQKLISSLSPAVSGGEMVWTWTLPPHFPKGKYLRVKVDGGTLKQGGRTLPWDPRGFYEISLDAGELVLDLTPGS